MRERSVSAGIGPSSDGRCPQCRPPAAGGLVVFRLAAVGSGMENGRRGRACRNCRLAKRSSLTLIGRSAIVAVDWRFHFIALCLQRVSRSGSRPNSVAPPDRFCHAGLRFGPAVLTKRGKLGLPRRTIRPAPCNRPDRRQVGLRRGHRLPALPCVLRQSSRLFRIGRGRLCAKTAIVASSSAPPQ